MPTRATPRGEVKTGRMSMAQTLSLLTTVAVVAVLATAIVVTWLTLTRSAISVAQDRIQRGVQQLAAVATTGVRQGTARYAPLTTDPAVLRALGSTKQSMSAADRAAVNAALDRVATRADSGLPIELWRTDGSRLAFVGDDLPEHLALDLRGENGAAASRFRPGLEDITPADSLQLGRLYRVGDQTFFWMALPVRAAGRPIGYVLQQRRIATNPQTERTVRELTGDSVTGYYHNADGTGWTTFGGRPARPPAVVPSDTERVTRPMVGRLVSASAPVQGTPLVMSMEVPQRTVLVGATAAVRRLGILSLLLTCVGALVAFLVGRRVARPLSVLTDAAGAVAHGDYSTRVSTAGSYEVASLAASFNAMAQRVGESRDALAQREEELRRLAETAEAANRAKSEFLAAMSHELRTPLNAIGGYAELIEMEIRGPISDEQRRDLARIRTSQQHLLGLIGGVLDLSRIESGRVHYSLETVPLAPLLDAVQGLVAPQAAAKQQVLHMQACAANVAVVVDREKFRQILLNLLSNAVRHTPSGSTITVTSTRAGQSAVQVTVCDDGPGIPPEMQESVFEPFVQLDRSLTHMKEGVGLGLAISRDLARGMGGDLHVAHVQGMGACFVVTLPSGEIDEATNFASTLEMPSPGDPVIS